jgi:hypothetical protein
MAINRLAIIFAALALSACSSIPLDKPSAENRPVCEIGRAKAYVVLMLGWAGVALKLTDESAKVICAK